MVLSAVLHIGNIKLMSVNNGEGSKVDDESILSINECIIIFV